MTSPRHVVLLAAAGAPLWRIGGVWCRTDLPEPLPPLSVSSEALWQLLDEELLEPLSSPDEDPWEQREAWLTADGWGEVEELLAVLAMSSDDRPSRLEILRRLAAAGEGVRREREADEDELLTLIDVLAGATVMEWVAPSRGRWVPDPRRPDEPLLGHRERPAQICYDWELSPLRELGLVVVAGGRALLTGAGKWAAADRDAPPPCDLCGHDAGSLAETVDGKLLCSDCQAADFWEREGGRP